MDWRFKVNGPEHKAVKQKHIDDYPPEVSRYYWSRRDIWIEDLRQREFDAAGKKAILALLKHIEEFDGGENLVVNQIIVPRIREKLEQEWILP